jgi:hypothetical protein
MDAFYEGRCPLEELRLRAPLLAAMVERHRVLPQRLDLRDVASSFRRRSPRGRQRSSARPARRR